MIIERSEETRRQLRDLMGYGEMTFNGRAARLISAAKVAELIGVSEHTVEAWLKTSKTPPPKWAVELLRVKIDQAETVNSS